MTGATLSRALTACVAAVLAGCASAPGGVAEENKALVRRYIEEVFNTGDVARLPAFVSPDYVEVYRNEVYPLGLEGAREHVLGVRRAFPDLRLTVERQFGDGEWVVTCITARGTHQGPFLGAAPTGKLLEFTGVNVDRVVDGRIVAHEGAANLLAPLLEAGAILVSVEGQ